MFTTKEAAEREAADMQGWNNITVVVDDEPDITGVPNIYILATDPFSGRKVVFDGSDPYARFL